MRRPGCLRTSRPGHPSGCRNSAFGFAVFPGSRHRLPRSGAQHLIDFKDETPRHSNARRRCQLADIGDAGACVTRAQVREPACDPDDGSASGENAGSRGRRPHYWGPGAPNRTRFAALRGIGPWKRMDRADGLNHGLRALVGSRAFSHRRQPTSLFRLLPVRFAAFGRDCHEQQRDARTAPRPGSELSH